MRLAPVQLGNADPDAWRGREQRGERAEVDPETYNGGSRTESEAANSYVYSFFLLVWPGATSIFLLLVVMPFVPSSGSEARSRFLRDKKCFDRLGCE